MILEINGFYFPVLLGKLLFKTQLCKNYIDLDKILPVSKH